MGVARTDSELVEASRRGELDAFGHLVARYQDLVTAVSYSSTGDRMLGEDVAQETFLAAWRHIDRVRDTGRIRPWLCGIARNLGRKARKRTRREEPIDVDAHAGDGADPFEHVARDDADRIVRDALMRIPDAYREVLVLYYRDDRSIREVAETLGISEAAVEQRLSRGRRYLADSVTALVERSLRGTRPRRDLVAAVLAAIAAYAIPSRVDASPPKGSTMLKLAAAVSALAVVGTTAYLATRSHHAPHTAAAPRTLHYGAGVARPPTLAAVTTPRAIAARSAAAGDLSYLPADADAVLGIDLAQLRSSTLWQQFVAPALSSAEPIRDFEAMCGFDPIASLGSVTFGLRGFGNDASFAGTIVLHGIDRTKAMACFNHDGVAKAEQVGAHVTVDGNIALLVAPDGYHTGFTFLDDTTALVVLGPEATKDGIANIAAGGGGLDASNGFQALFANVNATDSLWLVVTDASPLLASINSEIASYTSIQLHGVYGSIGMSDAFTVQGAIRLDSPEHAAQIVSDAQKELDALSAQGLAGKYFDQLDVISDGSDVLADVRMNLLQLIAFQTTGLVDVDVDVKKSGS